MNRYIHIIASGSSANAVLYFGKVLVDCGVNYKTIKPYLPEIDLILISHSHSDHCNEKTMNRIAFEYPNITILRTFKTNEVISCRNIRVRAFHLYHDVSNFGFLIFSLEEDRTVFHATDTAHLDGITASGFDYYCIETNYDEDKIDLIAAEQISRGEFSHAEGSKNSHLSLQQAQRFFNENRGEHSVFIGLHKSDTYLD
ncbi:MAG: MBL fold metallo-hydrolase [Dysgonamonadaceae bacterium]|jgi:phosphoribosyl 1,2-cyclic phosphodiesterase|nr:MBL fold metallo-hydrolase [Dysgonamonadaceae bacterium]